MKIVTPEYYKDFKCIAGDCTDTCCAGWDVDVDPKAYEYYKKVEGQFGNRLKSVMVPDEEGGCTFTLNNGRCPFLNDKNLCDLYIALGEDQLCDTCDEFPRFKNEYGSVREIGIAPSCKTAGELIFNYKDKLTFTSEEKQESIMHYNDIDPQTFFQLKSARNVAYEIASNRKWTIKQRCFLLLKYAQKIQKKLDAERDELIANVVKQFKDVDYCDHLINQQFGKKAGKGKDAEADRAQAYQSVFHYFDSFTDMEVINPDWYQVCEQSEKFLEYCEAKEGSKTYWQIYQQFDQYYEDRQFEYEQLLMYYIYRYFLDAVNDYDLLLKLKIMAVGYIVLKHADIVAWHKNGQELSKTEQIDIAHLYSRQLEHSYINFAKYMEFYESKRIYSFANIMRLISL